MKRNRHELRVCVDVDQTLVRPMDTLPANQCILANYYGMVKLVEPMNNNIELLKSYKYRGYEVTVHSANGEQWAAAVVESLGLEEYVDWTATKPLKSVDDLPANEWLPQVFIPEPALK